MLEFYKSMLGLSLVKRLPSYEGPMNSVVNKTELIDAGFTAVVSPNNDTLYSMIMCDLRAEPLVLHVPPVPPERYFSFALIDQYTHLPAFIGTRMGDTKGGTFLLAGPSWDGTTRPDGVTRVIRVESDFLFCLGRTQVNGKEDLPTVLPLMAQYAVEPLSAAVPSCAPKEVEPLRPSDLPIYDAKKATSVEFIGFFNWLLAHVEPNPADSDALARYSRIGVAPGAPFFADALPEEIRDAIDAGVRAGETSIDHEVGELGKSVNGWHLPFGVFGDREVMQGRWLVRAAAARMGLFGNPEGEAFYPFAAVDGEGEPLDANRHDYVLHLPEPPVDAFWSVTMYRLPERLFVANQLKPLLDRRPLPRRPPGPGRIRHHLPPEGVPGRGQGIELAARTDRTVQPHAAPLHPPQGGHRRNLVTPTGPEGGCQHAKRELTTPVVGAEPTLARPPVADRSAC